MAADAPWKKKPLDEWAIVGMNHYNMAGERRLFVAMTKGGKCIVSEGKDDEYLWNRLLHQAWKHAEDERAASFPTLPKDGVVIPLKEQQR